MDYALSSDDIIKKMKGKTKIVLYNELKNYNRIDNVFGPYDCIVLLYLDSHNTGHWTALINRPDRLEFFDPYGLKPDTEFEWYDKKTRHNYNFHGLPYLSKLLKNSGKPVEYNHFAFQDINDPKLATCGRHVIARLKCRKLSLTEYINAFRKIGGNYDELVTDLIKI
jgi:hypothetical protein